MKALAIVVLCALYVACAAACEAYHPPPVPVIVGLESGVLTDVRAPLVVGFGMKVVPETLSLKVVLSSTDIEGRLGDEDDDPSTELEVLVSHDPFDGDRFGKTELLEDGLGIKITPDGAFPVGPKLELVVEGGLRSRDGTVLHMRRRIPFSYRVSCAGERPTVLQSGVYFVLLDVEQPVGVQVQLYGVFAVEEATGIISAKFTNADRNPDPALCDGRCTTAEVCRLLPAAECVAPSTRAGNVDEWPDFVPNATPPTGYAFPVQGCAVDDTRGTGLLTAPATMVVQSPNVTIDGLTLTAEFVADGAGGVRASGSLVADSVRLGSTAVGPGKGTMSAVRLPDTAIPAGVPQPDPPPQPKPETEETTP